MLFKIDIDHFSTKNESADICQKITTHQTKTQYVIASLKSVLT